MVNLPRPQLILAKRTKNSTLYFIKTGSIAFLQMA